MKSANVCKAASFLVVTAITFAWTPATHATVIDPAFVAGLQNGLDISDGGGDIFDGGFVLSVDVDGGGFTSFNAPVQGSAPHYFGDQTIDGVDVNRRVKGLVDNGLLTSGLNQFTDWAYVRYLDSYTNTTNAPVTVVIDYDSDMGTDDDNDIETDTGGTGADLETDDRWFLHGEDGGDPHTGWVLHDGTGAEPSFVDAEDDQEEIEWDFEFLLAPGETQRFLYFLTARNDTDVLPNEGDRDDARADVAALFGVGAGDLPSLSAGARIQNPFLGWISNAERAQVVNFSLPSTVPEPVTGVLGLLGLGVLGLATRRRVA